MKRARTSHWAILWPFARTKVTPPLLLLLCKKILNSARLTKLTRKQDVKGHSEFSDHVVKDSPCHKRTQRKSPPILHDLVLGQWGLFAACCFCIFLKWTALRQFGDFRICAVIPACLPLALELNGLTPPTFFLAFLWVLVTKFTYFIPPSLHWPLPSPRPISWYPWRTLIVYRLAVCLTTLPALVYFIILTWTMISSTRDCSLIQKARFASLSVTAIIIHSIFSSTYLFLFQLFCKAKSSRSACHHRQCTYVCFL